MPLRSIDTSLAIDARGNFRSFSSHAVKAPDEETAVQQANEKARADWEDSDGECPSGRDLGMECPVCTGAAAVTEEEYTAWKKELDEMP